MGPRKGESAKLSAEGAQNRKLTLLQAIQEAMIQEMERDKSIFLIGEDIRIGGGFGVTRGLTDRFGTERVIDTPISEAGYVGVAIGAAVMGMRPIVEFQFGDFVFCAMDQIVNEAAKLRYMSGGQISVPIVLRLPVGANRRAAQHGQCSESVFMGIPGLQLAVPSTPYDAKGLMISSIRDNNPVLFFEHKLLYSTQGIRGRIDPHLPQEVPEEEYAIPLGKASVVRRGADVTVVATQIMLHRAVEAAEDLSRQGIEAEVIDPRTLVPLDRDTIIESVRKTGRLLITHEAPGTGGWAGEIAISVEESIEHPIPIRRVTTADVPIPYSPVLESAVIPGKEQIIKGIRSLF